MRLTLIQYLLKSDEISRDSDNQVSIRMDEVLLKEAITTWKSDMNENKFSESEVYKLVDLPQSS